MIIVSTQYVVETKKCKHTFDIDQSTYHFAWFEVVEDDVVVVVVLTVVVVVAVVVVVVVMVEAVAPVAEVAIVVVLPLPFGSLTHILEGITEGASTGGDVSQVFWHLGRKQKVSRIQTNQESLGQRVSCAYLGTCNQVVWKFAA